MTTFERTGLRRLLAGIIAFSLPLIAQHGSTTRSNPFNTQSDRVEGARLFRAHCAACHGPDGAGSAAGPDLTSGLLRRSDSDESIFEIVAKGIPGTNMPPFSGSGREVWQVVAHVRSLSIGKGAGRARGDRLRGAVVFQKSGCPTCHAIEGAGGTLGPDLGSIGSERSLSHLERSVNDPQDEVSPEYWMLRARTTSGEQIGGLRLNEDTFSVQYRDKTGLKSVFKRDLAQYDIVRTSPMPAFKGKLTGSEFDHLISYLASRREEKHR